MARFSVLEYLESTGSEIRAPLIIRAPRNESIDPTMA